MPDAHPACPDHGATARNDGTCMVRGCRYGQRVTSPADGGRPVNATCTGCGGPLRLTVGRAQNLYTCDTDGCGGNLRLDVPPSVTSPEVTRP